MIITTFNLMKMGKIEPLADQSVFETVIPPLQRVKDFSDVAFEEFIAEWAVACAKSKYKDVYRIGGAGDKGRDVIAEDEEGVFDYYQCKRYSVQLQPSQYWIEFGKLCYFIYNKDIPMPKKYYIIASLDLSKKMRTLLENKENIRTGLIKEWDGKCSKNLIEKKTITLSGDLLKFIQKFDFNIVDTYSINTIIEEHRHTNYFYFRFGGNIKPKRNIKIEPSTDIENTERKYLKKILIAYSENKKEHIDVNKINQYVDLIKDFSSRRQEYYSAESLKRCIRDIFSSESEFEILKNEMYSGISDFLQNDFKDGFDKLRKTMHESTKVNLSISRVDNDLHFVGNDDKKGICHHLANDDLVEWGTSNE
ncbi:ABC-three component system protein [Clostridium estertheticum]|uniref:ABC-three component system protein n=1 Tax=Clostridium estertheticum TaxID=238834 RepID=UPI001CF37746|nr:ABC-three component system protein [Clostridium estertheticum]MCB2356414.1 restriction endonuclease [Clostridium estertheticum]WAG39641.1 restriction endonuclease [Clostridium estertheticum]